MGAITGDSLVTFQEWESVKRQTNAAIEQWIHEQMLRKGAVVVFVGAKTASSDWVDYEIRKAWRDKRPLVGIRIHGLKDLNGHTSRPGPDPFASVRLDSGWTLDHYVRLHNPNGFDSQAVYRSIATNLDNWIAGAVKQG
jgi:hypothetical protein